MNSAAFLKKNKEKKVEGLLLKTWPRVTPYLPLIMVLILASFLRFWRLAKYMMFIGDFGRDYLVARDMVLTHQIPLVGIPSSVPWLYQGPFSIWMIAASLWLGRFSPVAPAFLMAALGVLTVWLVYWLGKKMFGTNPALLGALLMAASPLSVAHSRMPYHTSPIPLFALLYFWTLFNGSPFWSGFFVSTLFQFEIANAPLFLLLPFAFWQTKQRKKAIFNSFLGLMLPLVPKILYDFSQGYLPLQTLGFGVWAFHRGIGWEPQRAIDAFKIIGFYLKSFFFGI